MTFFTKREKIVLSVVVILFFLFLVFPALLDQDYELLYLLFIVLPLGVLLVTDKERLASQMKKDDDN